AQLKQQLFGPKSDKLTPEQEEQLQQLAGDLQEQAQRPPPESQTVLQDERKTNQQRSQRRRRHFIPAQLETQRTVLEPPEDQKVCEHCHKPKKKMGEELTTEYEYVPAKLIIRQIVRPKYGSACTCGCGVSIAPLPPRLLPQSKLGLGLAVHLLLSRFDDHLAYYTLERIFRERHGLHIPRQQMVQWVEKIAFLLLAIY